MKNKIITIDGPSGTGKSTVAKEVAKKLGFCYLDTGALYRGAALAIDLKGSNIDDDSRCREILSSTTIKLIKDKIFVNGKDVSSEIRSPRISNLASRIAVHSSVREYLVEIQRSSSLSCSVVAEGRDTGSVVFPNADVKIYLDASLNERARRRHKELISKGINIGFDQVLEEIQERDHRDKTRGVAPLVVSENAIVVNTTQMSIKEVISRVLKIIKDNLAFASWDDGILE
ncbi:MAG: (d)CMP kinase [Deltaproteobacteria bacterium]|nr:(d)CMP kinase [Deltaproteobacteria bacterium]